MKDVEEDFCKCESRSGEGSEIGEFGYWLICSDCGKRIEDGFEYYNHWDGEDHPESEC